MKSYKAIINMVDGKEKIGLLDGDADGAIDQIEFCMKKLNNVESVELYELDKSGNAKFILGIIPGKSYVMKKVLSMDGEENLSYESKNVSKELNDSLKYALNMTDIKYYKRSLMSKLRKNRSKRWTNKGW